MSSPIAISSDEEEESFNETGGDEAPNPTASSSNNQGSPTSGKAWKTKFKEYLDSVESLGEFAASIPINPPSLHPKISIQDLDENFGKFLNFPVSKVIAEGIRNCPSSEKAPFGKGKEKVLDESVRKAIQVDAERVKFREKRDQDVDSPTWNKFVEETAKTLVKSMGLSSAQVAAVEAHLYKFLLYEEGGKFEKHRDTEKEPGMFGTMIIHLPSDYCGGELVVQHGGTSRTFDYADKSLDGFFATAFFADCEHELRPVTNGIRVVLAYNLVLNKPNSELPSADLVTDDRLGKLGWNEELHNVGYILEHKYTPQNLRFPNLKGRDRVIADLIRSSKDENGNPRFVVSLILLNKMERGSAVYDYDYAKRRRWDYDSNDETHEMEEVYETEQGMKLWVGVDGMEIGFSNTSQFNDCLLLDGTIEELFKGENPDDEDYEGYTGNAPPTLTYEYYKGALVVTPKENVAHLAGILGQKAAISILRLESDAEIKKKLAQLIIRPYQSKVIGYSYSYRNEPDKLETVGQVFKRVGIFDDWKETLIELAIKNSSLSAAALFLQSEANPTLKKKLADFCIEYFKTKDGFDGKAIEQVARVFSKVDLLIEKKEELIQKAFHRFLDDSPNSSFYTISYIESAIKTLDNLDAGLLKILELITKVSNKKVEKEHEYHGMLSNHLIARSASILQLAATEKSEVMKLVHKRIVYLESITRAGPNLSYAFTTASFPSIASGSHLVQAFLRSDRTQETFTGFFNGIRHARNWAAKYFPTGPGYSARATEGGIGPKAYVAVTKTNKIHASISKIYDEQADELRRLKSAFGFKIKMEVKTEDTEMAENKALVKTEVETEVKTEVNTEVKTEIKTEIKSEPTQIDDYNNKIN